MLALVIANLVPLAGVAFLDWRLFDVMLVYWLENGVIGVYNLVRMATAGEGRASAIAFAPFFTFHYGMFWLVHGVFVVALFGPTDFGFGPLGPAGAAPPGPVFGPSFTLPIVGPVAMSDGVAWGVVGLVASHGVSLVQTWFLGGEREGVSPADLMKRPYARVAVLHVTLIAGGFALTILGAPVLALVLLVALKIAVDVVAHAREHRAAPAAAAPVGAPAS